MAVGPHPRGIDSRNVLAWGLAELTLRRGRHQEIWTERISPLERDID